MFGRLYKGAGWQKTGILDSGLLVKPSTLWVPLAAQSCHHWGVHRAWPRAEVSRIQRLCSSKASLDLAVERFRAKMVGALGRALVDLTPPQRPMQLRVRENVSWLVIHHSLNSSRLTDLHDPAGGRQATRGAPAGQA